MTDEIKRRLRQAWSVMDQYEEGASIDEIAAVEDLSRRVVHARLDRALRLRRIMRPGQPGRSNQNMGRG